MQAYGENLALFDAEPQRNRQQLGPQACVLPAYAQACMEPLLAAVHEVCAAAPPRSMVTRGGYTMSVKTTSCGRLGWVSDLQGYRYSPCDPLSGQPWPAMPQVLLQLARDAAQEAGFEGFVPDACLVNCYEPGARMALHQDRNERDFSAPIVSVSLGIAATFLFGGLQRSDRAARVPLFHGDVVVWGGVDRMRFHGVAPLRPASHPTLGAMRINLTLRKAG